MIELKRNNNLPNCSIATNFFLSIIKLFRHQITRTRSHHIISTYINTNVRRRKIQFRAFPRYVSKYVFLFHFSFAYINLKHTITGNFFLSLPFFCTSPGLSRLDKREIVKQYGMTFFVIFHSLFDDFQRNITGYKEEEEPDIWFYCHWMWHTSFETNLLLC